MRNVWPLFAMHRPTSASPNARIIPLYHRPVVQSTMRLSPFSTGGNNHSWAQIGRATEIIKSDLGDGFFELHGPGGATGLSTLSIYHRNITFTDPFHNNNNNHNNTNYSNNDSSASNSSTSSDPSSPLLNQLPPVIAQALPSIPRMDFNNKVVAPQRKYLVKGKYSYAFFVGLTRLGIMAYFDDASLEIVRCRNVVGSGPLKKADLDDEYAGQAEMDDGIESTFGAKKRGVWRRRQSSFEQEEDGESVKLVVRWMFEGTPRHKLLYAKLLSPLTPPQPVVYEGVFVYRFDNDTGLVINHSLESMSPTPWIPAVCKWWLERKSRRAAKKEAMEGGGSGSGGTSGGGDGGGNGLPQLNSHPGHGLVCEEQKVLESTKKPMSF